MGSVRDTAMSGIAASLQDSGSMLEDHARSSQGVVQQLREERIALLAQLETLESDLAALPLLEQELLYHADRADSNAERADRNAERADRAEKRYEELEARIRGLEVLAYARARSRPQLLGVRQLRALLYCRAERAMHRLLLRWRAAPTPEGEAARPAIRALSAEPEEWAEKLRQ